MRLWNLYYYALQFSPALPLYLAVRHPRALDRPLRLFGGYLATSFVLTCVMTPMAKSGVNNVWLMNLSFLAYACWILLMFAAWQRHPLVKQAMIGAIGLFFLVWGLEIWLAGVFFEFTTYARPLLGSLFVACALITIFQRAASSETLLLGQPAFWISSGVLLYFGGMLAVNVASQLLLKSSRDGLAAVFMIQPALNLTSHLLYFEAYRVQCRR